MANVKIVTDSCSDLGKDIREKYDIEYVRMNTVYKDEETPASLDWEYYSPKELYDIMRNGERVLTTQVPPEEFKTVFTKFLEEGNDIVYIGCSAKLSGSINIGTMVAKELMEKYPERTIKCIDALNSCMGEGALTVYAANLRNEGLSVEEIANKVIEVRLNVNQFATVHSLEFLKRAGRVTASSAFFGNMLGVKPILISDKNGANTPIKKVKGRENSLREIVNQLKETIVDAENQTIFLAHADCQEDADFVKSLVEQEIPCKDIYVNYIGPIIGASVGPGTVGLFAFGKEVTVEA